MAEFVIIKLNEEIRVSGKCATCGQKTDSAEYLWIAIRRVNERGESPVIGSDQVRIEDTGPVCDNCAVNGRYKPFITRVI